MENIWSKNYNFKLNKIIFGFGILIMHLRKICGILEKITFLAVETLAIFLYKVYLLLIFSCYLRFFTKEDIHNEVEIKSFKRYKIHSNF